MKVLELAPYAFIEGHPHGSRNTSGLAYMIRSICDMVATRNEVRLLTQSIFTGEQTVNGWLLVKRTLTKVLLHFKWRYFRLYWLLQKREKQTNPLRLMLYCVSAGQVEDYIRKWNPDVVHVHGIGPQTLPFYVAASRCNARVVTTLHGLLSFHNIVPVPESAKSLESHFIEMCLRNDYSMTVISTGMKSKILDRYQVKGDNIMVIPNCFRPVEYEVAKSFQDGKVKRIICVGALYPLKNQIQVIRVLPKVQQQVGDSYKVTLDLVGDGEKALEWKQYVVDNNIENVSFCGRLPQQEVFRTISQADLLVFPSIEEGFGIPIIEAYNCGTPVVSFADLDAASDVADEDCCIFASNRSDASLVEAIVDALTREWDSEKIKTCSKKFSINQIADKYCEALGVNHKEWDKSEIEKIIREI